MTEVSRPQSSKEDVQAAGNSRRLPRIQFLSSIRFRLTAWYTLVLVIIIVVLGVLLSTFLSRALEEDVDERLLNASNEVFEHTEQVSLVEGLYVGESESVTRDIDVQITTEFSALVTSGLFVAAMDSDRDRLMPDEGVVPRGVLELVDLEALREGQRVFQTVSVNGQRVRLFSSPIFVDLGGNQSELGAVVLVGESLEPQERAMDVLNQWLRTAGAAGVLLATWGGWILAGRALAPVTRISKTADAIARKGDTQESLSTRLEVHHSGDELAQLSLIFNDMLERIERAFMAQRRFVADASHELRTPLTAIRGNVDVLSRHARNGREIEPEDLQEALADMKRESSRMARLIEDLLLLARTDAEGLGHMVHPEPVSLDVVAREAFRTAESIATGQRLHLSIRQPLMIYGDGDRLVQVMIILLDNALRHTPAGKTVDLIVDAAETDDGKQMCARIQVVDRGEGISREHLPHLFERFYRVEGSRSRMVGGSGLGLAIALAIVRGHNGWVEVESPNGQGTHFTVWLPILEAPESEQKALAVLPKIPESQQA